MCILKWRHELQLQSPKSMLTYFARNFLYRGNSYNKPLVRLDSTRNIKEQPVCLLPELLDFLNEISSLSSSTASTWNSSTLVKSPVKVNESLWFEWIEENLTDSLGSRNFGSHPHLSMIGSPGKHAKLGLL